MVELRAEENMTANHVSTRVTVRPRKGGVPADLGAPDLPGSKSHAQRALILAGLGTGNTTLENVPDSGDVQVMGAAIEALGARIEKRGSTWRVQAAPELREAHIDCHDNGTSLRMLAMVVGLLGGRAWFSGTPRLQARPLDDLPATLRDVGVAVEEGWPLSIDGRAAGMPAFRVVQVATRRTSQVASGAVLGLACAARRRGEPSGVVRVHAGAETATLYLALTTTLAKAFGIDARATPARRDGAVAAGDFTVPVSPSTGPSSPGPYRVPPDASAATFVGALAALHGLAVPSWPDDGNPERHALADLRALAGAPPDAALEFRSLHLWPDSFPALCVVASARRGRTVLRGAPALRHKESDRVAAMAAGLRPLGVVSDAHEDGLTLVGCDLRALGAPAPIALPAPPDHRVVMALALLGTLVAPGVSVENRAAVAKSWPRYFDWLGRVAEVR